MASPPPLVSIVLPVYNGARYLRESLESCLDQSYPHWELILVDDASVDQTPAIAAEFAARDGRVQCIRHEVNRRLPAALNTGFAHARGQYLTWTSDDNCYHARALEEMVRVLTSRQEVQFVYADYDVIAEDGLLIQTVRAQPPIQLLGEHTGLACFLYRRGVYEQLGGYSEDLFLAEDYDYWLRILAARYHMEPLHQNLYRYRRHAHSLTDEYRGRAFLAAEQAILRNLPDLGWVGAAARGKAYLYLASLATWRGARRVAASYCVTAVRYAPGATGAKVVSFLFKYSVQRLLRFLRETWVASRR
jgi:glycosyltransferase involved in cell wall biosynthesis